MSGRHGSGRSEAAEAAFAAAERCVRLDGGPAGGLLAWLAPEDVSLAYDAGRGEVTRFASGAAEVVGEDPFAVLEAELAGGDPADRWFGYFGYACRRDLAAAPDPSMPDAVWMRPSRVHRIRPAPPAAAPGAGEEAGAEDPPEWYLRAFERVQRELRAGNSYEVNLTHRIGAEGPADPLAVYRRLLALNPAPYAGFLRHDVQGAAAHLLSSSPECFARIGADGMIETRPIKGTTARGATAEEDRAAAERLALDGKFRAENLMIVDLLRNDLARVCEVGSVQVPALFAVESYPSVHQLVSTVRGRLRGDVSSVAALRELFPAGSMTGAPKLRTMEIIADVEATPRGAYAGAFGWIAADGSADLGVIIRSLMTTGHGGYLLGTGGGITVQSDPAEEYAEAGWKAQRLLRALRWTP